MLVINLSNALKFFVHFDFDLWSLRPNGGHWDEACGVPDFVLGTLANDDLLIHASYIVPCL